MVQERVKIEAAMDDAWADDDNDDRNVRIKHFVEITCKCFNSNNFVLIFLQMSRASSPENDFVDVESTSKYIISFCMQGFILLRCCCFFFVHFI